MGCISDVFGIFGFQVKKKKKHLLKGGVLGILRKYDIFGMN